MENRAALLTPVGRGAIGVIAAHGSAAVATVDQCFTSPGKKRFTDLPANRPVFGKWDGQRLGNEEAVVLRLSDCTLEVQCHGGAAACSMILCGFRTAGCQIVDSDDWGCWPPTANEIHREIIRALASARTRRTAGLLAAQYENLPNELSLASHEIRTNRLSQAQQRIQALLARATLGVHLAEPWKVTIGGLPNVGKSTLMNVISGYVRSIVGNNPGTTRDILTSHLAIDGWPIELSDVAGLRDTDDTVEVGGIELATRQLMGAELVVWVLDGASLMPEQFDDVKRIAAGQISDVALELGGVFDPILVVNKMDLIGTPESISTSGALYVSALRSTGIDALLATIAERLVPTPVCSTDSVPFCERQVDLLNFALDSLAADQPTTAYCRLRQCLQG